MQRVHAIYKGNVQGVGFRFTARRIASRLKITGFVKNLYNGDVEVVCEGNKDELDAFIKDIKESMNGYVTKAEIDWQSARGEFQSFEIRF